MTDANLSAEKCLYCSRPKNADGSINHLSKCAGLEDVDLNRLQHDALVAQIAALQSQVRKLELQNYQIAECIWLNDKAEAVKWAKGLKASAQGAVTVETSGARRAPEDCSECHAGFDPATWKTVHHGWCTASEPAAETTEPLCNCGVGLCEHWMDRRCRMKGDGR